LWKRVSTLRIKAIVHPAAPAAALTFGRDGVINEVKLLGRRAFRDAPDR
jgi:hypothetical protein